MASEARFTEEADGGGDTWRIGPGLVGVLWIRLSDGSWWGLPKVKIWRTKSEGGIRYVWRRKAWRKT